MGSGQVESEQEIEVDLGFGMLGLGLGFLMGNGDLVERGERGTKRRHAKISIVKSSVSSGERASCNCYRR